eukprot:jgi/Mesen1/9603/ME000659S08975
MSSLTSLDRTRAQVALLTLFLGKAEARDKICRAIQYGSKCVSGGQPGVAADIDKTTSSARKVFRIAKIQSALMACYFGLDQFVWLGRSGLYQNKEKTDMMSKVSLYCFMTGTATSTIIEVIELYRLSGNIKRASRELKRLKAGSSSGDEAKLREQQAAQLKRSRERTLNLIKVGLDVIVGVGLLQLAPKTVNSRVTGALGTVTALIACYQLFPAAQQVKAKTA